MSCSSCGSFCYTLFTQIKDFNWAQCPSRFASSNSLIRNGMNAASAGPVASILFPNGLYDTCVFSFKSNLLALCHQSERESQRVCLRQWERRGEKHMCYQKMYQIGGRKPGRQLPVPVVAGIGQDDLCAAENTAYTKWHDQLYCMRVTRLNWVYRSNRKAL